MTPPPSPRRRPLLAALGSAALVTLAAAAAAPPARAEVAAFEVLSTAPAFGGRAFEGVGAYELLRARATLAVDPDDPRDARIADLALAPRDAATGRVRAVAEVHLLRPADPARGSRALVVEAPNRGNKAILPLLNDATAGGNALDAPEAAGDGHLMRAGHALAWVAWQFDVAPGEGRVALEVPRLAGVTGPSREEWVFDHARSPVEVALSYPMAEGAEAAARLTVRARPDDPRATPPGLSFRVLSPTRIEIARPATGFDDAALHELVYEARDPAVAGLGLAAFRDVADFLRRAPASAGNPHAGRADLALAFGASQSGRFLRDFLYHGFNDAGEGRRAFDGLHVHIAGTRRAFLNARFAQPGRNPRHHEDNGVPADDFPFSYEVSPDPLTGARDGLLAACRATGTCPVVAQTDSEHELWGSRGGLLVSDGAGGPLAFPPEVRAYLLAGHPHAAAPGSRSGPSEGCALPSNPLHPGPALRAILAALGDWAATGREPPPSRYPSLVDGTLGLGAPGYPAIPGLPYTGAHTPARLWDRSRVPPAATGTYAVPLPRVDSDGNLLGGLRLPAVAVPRATYTGWNPRAEGRAPGMLCANAGGALPFARTRAEREASGDPRPSLEERYADEAAYVAAARAAAEALMADRLMLPEDVAPTVEAARAGRLAGL